MKQFRFGLDTVLDYKMQTLEHLRTEHAAINRKVVRQEEEVIRAHSKFRAVMKMHLTGQRGQGP